MAAAVVFFHMQKTIIYNLSFKLYDCIGVLLLLILALGVTGI